MTRQRIHVFLVAASLFALSIQPWARADSGPEAAKAPGEVNFAISCGPDAQNAFKQAVWTLHSFWYPEALKAFTAITVAEPSCAMGYWGIAMSHWYPLWYPPSPAALRAGSDAAEKAIAAGPKTEREKDYVAAITTFYRDSDKLDHQTRTIAYEKAMEQVYLRYPEDRELPRSHILLIKQPLANQLKYRFSDPVLNSGSSLWNGLGRWAISAMHGVRRSARSYWSG